MTVPTPLLLARDEGEHFGFLGSLTTVKIGGDRSGGVLSVVEQLAPRGFGPPLHRHDVEDELFSVLEGEVRFVCGDVDQVVTAGGTAWLPKGLPHQFQVVSETARLVQVSTPAQFESFLAAVGTPMDSAVLPGPAEVDVERLARISAEYRMELLGPPLPPLPE